MSSAAQITKEQIKSEIDNVRDEYLGVLYRIVLALEEPARTPRKTEPDAADEIGWSRFISEMYGSTADAPIERWPEEHASPGESGETPPLFRAFRLSSLR